MEVEVDLKEKSPTGTIASSTSGDSGVGTMSMELGESESFAVPSTETEQDAAGKKEATKRMRTTSR